MNTIKANIMAILLAPHTERLLTEEQELEIIRKAKRMADSIIEQCTPEPIAHEMD